MLLTSEFCGTHFRTPCRTRCLSQMGGFDIQKLEDGGIKLTYVNVVDLKITGVPQYLIDKIRTEQLKLVLRVRDAVIR